MPLKRNLFFTPSPTYMYVADKPLVYPDAKISAMLLQDIKKKFNFDYMENIKIPTQGFKEPGIAELQTPLIKAVMHRLKNPLNNSLVVTPIDEHIGYALFTLQPIKQGQIIGIYAGEWNTTEYSDPIYALGDATDTVKAVHCGGLARFIQHMPESLSRGCEKFQQAKDMKALRLVALSHGLVHFSPDLDFNQTKAELIQRFKEMIKEEEEFLIEGLLKQNVPISYANVSFIACQYGEINISVVIANCNIAAKTQLGVSYGRSYWAKKNIYPCLFDKRTGLISEWSNFYQNDECRYLFEKAIQKRMVTFAEVAASTPNALDQFLLLNEAFLVSEQEEYEHIKVPITDRTLWLSLVKRKCQIAFSPEEMTPENMQYCRLSTKDLQLVRGVCIADPPLINYLEQAYHQFRHYFFKLTVEKEKTALNDFSQVCTIENPRVC